MSRNPIARDLRTPKYRPRVVASKRRLAIIDELTRLSRNGWRDAHDYDYRPLEKELEDK
jgi:hypothetical protein